MDERSYLIGVDVGTGSVRAAVFSVEGEMLGAAVSPIEIFQSKDLYIEQSTEDIWENTCKGVKEALKQSGVPKDRVCGIGFDATCSLVALCAGDSPVSVSKTGHAHRNVIVWMDHRATEEADEINRTGDEALRYVGGTISPEMQLPKLLWLKRNLPDRFGQTAKYLDLADFMVYRACGRDFRSVCTLTCKWTYLAHEKRWSQDLFNEVGLSELLCDDRLGTEIKDLGEPAGFLTSRAAEELGLTTGAMVAIGIIDAHAGGIGMIGKDPETTLAVIGGTSSCHMAVSKEPIFVEGVWGPYHSAMIPGMWLNEGGQSATGALIDHVIRDSACYPELKTEAEQNQKSVYDILNQEIQRFEEADSQITQTYHVLGYFHGNRSPRANPHLRGMISGLSLNESKAELAKKYLAAIQSVAYGTRHIIEEMNAKGHGITKIIMCGGGTKNRVWLQEHADITACPIQLPGEPEAVLLGSAMLAAAASGLYGSLQDAMGYMSSVGETILPRTEFAGYHDKKYRVFKELYEDQMKYIAMMEKA